MERRCEELLEELKGKAPKIDEEKEAKNSTGYAAGGAIPSEQPKMQWKSLSVKADRPVQVYSQIPLGRNKNPADLMADDLKNYELDNRHKYVPRDLSRKNMNLQDDIDRDIKYAKFMK